MKQKLSLLTLVLVSGLLWTGCGKKSSSEPPDKNKTLTTLGVEEPLKKQIEWTAYYITPVTKSGEGKGRSVSFTGLDGKEKTVRITGSSFLQAEMEAVAVGVDKEGKKRFAYRASEGNWKELPEGSMGMGNRLNPLVPFRHTAADNSLYPYGSMIYVPKAVGVKFGNAAPMDGYFWVADSGGRIKGNHIDLFVGEEEVYQDFVSRNHPSHHETMIYRLPSAAKGFDPRKKDELAKLLVATGKLDETKQADDAAVTESLIKYQKTMAYIPEAEYGNATSATTLWFLTQLSLELKQESKKKDSEKETKTEPEKK